MLLRFSHRSLLLVINDFGIALTNRLRAPITLFAFEILILATGLSFTRIAHVFFEITVSHLLLREMIHNMARFGYVAFGLDNQHPQSLACIIPNAGRPHPSSAAT